MGWRPFQTVAECEKEPQQSCRSNINLTFAYYFPMLVLVSCYLGQNQLFFVALSLNYLYMIMLRAGREKRKTFAWRRQKSPSNTRERYSV